MLLMLYRRAYAARIKEKESSGNGKLISFIAGISWQCEGKEVKDYYANMAGIEKAKHAAAFPRYHFAPKKRMTAPGEDYVHAYGGKSRR